MGETPVSMTEVHRLVLQSLRHRKYPQQELSRLKEYIAGDAHADNHIALTPEQLSRYEQVIKALWEDYPVAYIVGYQDFAGLRFTVTPSVLIPRPETEELLDAQRDIEGSSKAVIVDVGTGSGAVLISLYYRLWQQHPQGVPARFTFIGIDLSGDALRVATDNAEKLLEPIPGYADNPIIWKQGSLLEPYFDLQKSLPPAHELFVLSNLPYVSEYDFKRLEQSTKYEPKLALVPPAGHDLIAELQQQAPLGTHLYLEQPSGDQTIEHVHIYKQKDR